MGWIGRDEKCGRMRGWRVVCRPEERGIVSMDFFSVGSRDRGNGDLTFGVMR